MSLLTSHDVCATPVNTPQEALADPHVVARGTVRDHGTYRSIRAPFLRELPDLGPPPEVGQHTDEVLASPEHGVHKSDLGAASTQGLPR